MHDSKLGPRYWYFKMIICFINKFIMGLVFSFKGREYEEEKGKARKFYPWG